MAARTPQKGRSTAVARTTPRPGRTGRILRRLGVVALVMGLGAAWMWQRTLPLSNVEVLGTVHADPSDIIRLTGVRPDSDDVFSLSPELIADRAQRNPWVRTARVRRLPTGTLSVRVEERTPVVLVMTDGSPSGFLDAEGFAMPLDTAADSGAVPYDVPLLTGAAPTLDDNRRVESRSLRETLTALAEADAATNALVSEIEWHPGGRAILWTAPAGGHPSIPVRLGRTGVADQLARLRAFWDQSVLPRPGTRFRQVDLRFTGQVVTQEGNPPSRDSTQTPSPTPVAG